MKVAIPIRNGRVSPVFDVASRLVVVDFEGGMPAGRSEFSVTERGGEARAALLQELGVSVLICGAVSNQTARIVERCGIELRPWIVGEIDDVLEAYRSGSLGSDGFIMPGCRRGQGGGRGSRQGRRFIRRGENRRGAGEWSGGQGGSGNRRRDGGGRNNGGRRKSE
jgi:predicted Fe-Mo cluster-binding NifX family protein